jgi:DNA polymerase elongation subunit (family B)
LAEAKGWLFDVYIQGSKAVLWIKTEEGENLRLTDGYVPFFHVEPTDAAAEEDLLYRLSECPEVRNAIVEERFTSLEPRGRRRRLIRVETYGTALFRRLGESLERSPSVRRVYNLDLRHVQRYLFTRLRVEPTSRVAVSYDGERLTGMEKIDDSQEIAPPPFSLLSFSVDYELSGSSRVVRRIRTASRQGRRNFEGGEAEVLSGFCSYIREADIDLLACNKCDSLTYPVLRAGFHRNRLPFDLGRCGDREVVRAQGSFAGRVLLGGIFYGFSADEWGVAGLVERARFAFAPMGLSTRWLSNKSIDSRGGFELLRRGHAIPREEYFERARALKELAARDRGGITITPEAGRLHENVAVLDFDSQYPNIILKNGLSYEAPGDREGGAGLLPAVVEPWLRRRLRLKKVRRTLEEGSPARLYCEERVDALKMILVTIYGISGCCRNRFGNVVTFEEINRRARKGMLRAKSVAEAKGFHIIYGDVDSLFLSRRGASREEYEALACEIARETGLPMSLDKHFRFVAFLPLKGDPASAALKRYFGLTFEGKVEARGIELRRSDTPSFIKEFQEELIRSIMGWNSLEEACTVGVSRGMELLRRYVSRVRNGGVGVEELVVMKRLGKNVGEYRASVAHRSAALQLLRAGREVEAGDDVPLIYTDHDHGNPLCRVRTPELFTGSYDREYYAEMLIEAARTVLRGMGIRLRLNLAQGTLEGWL